MVSDCDDYARCVAVRATKMVVMSSTMVRMSNTMVRRSTKKNALTRGRKGVGCFGRRWDQFGSSSLRTALL